MNQDTLGSREKCRRRAQQILEKGGRVLIDRCGYTLFRAQVLPKTQSGAVIRDST